MTPEDKLFTASVAAMQAYISTEPHYDIEEDADEILAKVSVHTAKALLAELDKEESA